MSFEQFERIQSLIVIWALLPLIVLFISFEIVQTLAFKKAVYDRKQLLLDLLIAIGKGICESFTVIVTLAIHLWAWKFRIFEISLPLVIQVPLALLVSDLIYYWIHRLGHNIPWIWATHSVHHTVTHLNFVASLRQGWTNLISLTWIVPLPFIILGFHPYWIELGLLVVIGYQLWVHTELIGDLGWVEKVFHTPRLHQLHHSILLEHRDRNFSGVLMIWDHLFGTYLYNDRQSKLQFGLDKDAKQRSGIFEILFGGWIELWNYIRKRSNDSAV